MKNIFTLLILSVCFLCANISGRAQNKFSDMEVNHVRVATPGLFFPRRIVSMLDLKSPVTELLFPFAGRQSHFGSMEHVEAIAVTT